MKCADCKKEMEKRDIELDSSLKVVLNYCKKCQKVVMGEEPPLKIKQNLIKLSKDHIGMYFNQNIVRSLGLKPGSSVLISVPDKKKIIIELSEVEE